MSLKILDKNLRLNAAKREKEKRTEQNEKRKALKKQQKELKSEEKKETAEILERIDKRAEEQAEKLKEGIVEGAIKEEKEKQKRIAEKNKIDENKIDKYDELASKLAKKNAESEKKELLKTKKEEEKLKKLKEAKARRENELKRSIQKTTSGKNNETFKEKVIREYLEGKPIKGSKKKEKLYIIEEYQKNEKKRLVENLKKAKEAVKKAESKKNHNNGSDATKASIWRISKRIKDLKAQLKVEQETKAIVEADLKELNESGLSGVAVSVGKSEKERKIKSKVEEIKKIQKELAELQEQYSRAQKKLQESNKKATSMKSEEVTNAKEKLEAAKLAKQYAELETAEDRALRLKRDKLQRKLQSRKRKARIKAEKKKKILENRLHESKIREKEQLLAKKAELLKKTKIRQEQIANDKVAKELLDNRDKTNFKKDSIRRVNKQIAVQKRKEMAEMARVDALEKKVKRAEIELKLNNEKLSKEAKEEFLKQKSKLDKEINELKKVKESLDKKNKKEFEKKNKKVKTVNKAKVYEDSMKVVLDKQAKNDWELHNQKAKEIKAHKRLLKEQLKTKKATLKRIGEKEKNITKEDKMKAAKAKIEKKQLKQQKAINKANKDLEVKAKLNKSKDEIEKQRLKERARRKALNYAAKKVEAEKAEKAAKINGKKLTKRQLIILSLKDEIKTLGIDVRRKNDDLEASELELKALKEKGDIADAIKQNVLERRIVKYKAEAKTLKDNLTEKQKELDRMLGVVEKQSKGSKIQSNEEYLRDLQAKAKRKEMEERRKSRVKNAALMAKAKKEKAKKEKEERVDFEYRVAEAEKKAMKLKIKKAKQERKEQRLAFMLKQQRLESDLDALAYKESMEEGLEEAERLRKKKLEKAKQKLLRQMVKMEKKANDDAEFEREVAEEMEVQRKADDKRRREKKYLEEKNRKDLEQKKNEKIKSSLTKDDERYINKEAKRRGEIADSLEKVVDKQKDEWTKINIESEKNKEQLKEEEKIREEKKRKLRVQRKIDTAKKKQYLKETDRLKDVLKEKKAMDRKIEAATRLTLSRDERRKAVEEVQKQILERRKLQDRMTDSLDIEAKLLAEKLAPLQAGISSRESKIANLKVEVSALKSEELPLLRDFLQTNQRSKSIAFQAERLAAAERIDKKAESKKVSKEGLEIKLKVKENYLHRLEKDRQLNIYRQKITVLKERLVNLDTTNIDENEINRILIIQYRQIEKSIVATQQEMENITMQIVTKEKEYEALIIKANKWRVEDKKDSIAKAAAVNLTPDQVSLRLDSLKQLYDNSKSGTDRAAFQIEMDKLYGELPEGIHEEILYESNRTVKKYVVIKGGEVDIYKMVMYIWGSAYYFKNGVAITKMRFDTGTKY